jgi:hypothetical protein
MEKHCILDEEKLCDDCGECLTCDLDPEKICDNCMRCVKKSNADYLAIEIDEVINATSPEEAPEFPAKAPKEKSEKSPQVKGVRPRKTRNAPS